ncbi:MAG: flagellar hook-associated protein FlgK [Pseudomonadota bacterium]
MSLSSTLQNALTGLGAAARSAQVVSNNVSNATTEGYSRQEIELNPKVVGGRGAGVKVVGVSRAVDEVLLREHRLAKASIGSAEVASDFQSAALNLIGEPQSAASLNARVVEFETALLEAASRPESDARLSTILSAAGALSEKLNSASDGIQVLRQDADAAIATEVVRLNTTLVQIQDLNEQILRAQGTSRDYPSLLDNRDRLINDISDLVPIRKLERANDTVALYTLTGTLLVDIEPAEFEFQTTTPITADMTQASGALSGLVLNGQALSTSGENGQIAGGRLAALFAVRDELAVTVQDNIDTVARDLISRFEDPTVDPTLTVGDPGLFTDGGAALDPLDTVGLAARVSVNDLVNPDEGGDLWRLRSGIGSAAAGPVGDASLIQAQITSLSEFVSPTGGTFSTSGKTAAGFASEIASLVGLSFQDSESRLTFATARFAGLDEALLAQGVDTDQELQKLLLIEQAYAANARVIQTADELIQLLIRL